MDRIDFRSDTVTWPTPATLAPVAGANVGDDVYGEDPTINTLEALAAEKVGKEAGLFVASGTMGNLVGIMSHATRGDEFIVGNDSHVMLWESGSIASLGSVIPRTLPTDAYGRMEIGAVEESIRSDNVHLPRSRVIHVENSYGSKNGFPIGSKYFAEIREVANRHQLFVHMDGARIFNAAAALSLDPSELTQYVDSVTFCLSKGLCAPVGSILCGSTTFIERARRVRKSLGGGMRQAGVLAAAGLISLGEMVDRLEEDHRHARVLADGLAQMPGIRVDENKVKTNLVFFDLDDEAPFSTQEIAQRMRERANVWVGTMGPRNFRAVTHYWIGQAEVKLFLDLLDDILQS